MASFTSPHYLAIHNQNTHIHISPHNLNMLVAGVRGWSDMKELAVQVIAGRQFRAFALFLIMMAAGASYMFGLYSPDLKAALGYDQTTLNLLSFFKEVGANLEVPSGLNELMPAWVMLLIGAILNFFGYFMIWLAVTHKILTSSVQLISLFMFIVAISESFTNRGSLVTCHKNFPESRGVVLWILKGCVGLSGAIITQLYHAFYNGDTKPIILLIGWLPATISGVFLHTIRQVPSRGHPHDLKVFYRFLCLSLALASFLMLMIMVQKNTHFSHPLYGVSAIVVLLVLLPLAGVFFKEYKILGAKSQASPEPLKEIQMVALKGINIDITETRIINDAKREGREEIRCQGHTTLQALSITDLIILISAYICGVGGTLTANDNLGQIGESLGYPKNSIGTSVSLMSIWNFLGRVFSSYVSKYPLRKHNFLRPLMLALILLLSCVGHLLIAFNAKNGLYVATVIIGFGCGAQWPLLFAIISDSDLSGLLNRTTLHYFGRVASLFGMYILSVLITGHLYDKEAKRQSAALGIQRKEGEELSCVGGECFRMTFLIIAATTFFGAIMCLVFVARTWKFNNRCRGTAKPASEYETEVVAPAN